MSWNDLRDFEPEYTTTTDDGLVVQVEKLGGGTLGKAYTGTWRYVVSEEDSGFERGRGQDFDTPGHAYTHAEAAVLIADLFTGEEWDAYEPLTIRVHTTAYEPWEEGQDEPTRIGTESEELSFDTLAECQQWLDYQGLTEASQDPLSLRGASYAWLSLPDGSQPHGYDGNYTGRFEEKSAHRGEGFTDATWFAILSNVTRKV